MIQLIDLTIQNPVQKKMTHNPSMIVMHYTAVDFNSTHRFFLNGQKDNGVIAHYVIDSDENGIIYQYLQDNYAGKHAGISYHDGLDNLNQYSIGIENVNYGFSQSDKGAGLLLIDNMFYYNFTEHQMNSLSNLTEELIDLYSIKPFNIVAHSDIAISFGRKEDPGPLFPWEKLAKEHGIGLWYNLSLTENEFKDTSKIINSLSEKEKLSFFINKLMEFGYGNPDLAPDSTLESPYQIKHINDPNIIDKNAIFLIRSYNMHYRPDKGISNSIDEKDFQIVNSLNIMKNITQYNDLSLIQLKDLYNTSDKNDDYFSSHEMQYSRIDDSVNLFFDFLN